MSKATKETPTAGHSFYQRLVIVISVATLILIGLISIFSATQSLDADSYRFLERQIMWLGIAVVAGVAVSMIDLERPKKIIPLGAIIGIGFLIAVLIPAIAEPSQRLERAARSTARSSAISR